MKVLTEGVKFHSRFLRLLLSFSLTACHILNVESSQAKPMPVRNPNPKMIIMIDRVHKSSCRRTITLKNDYDMILYETIYWYSSDDAIIYSHLLGSEDWLDIDGRQENVISLLGLSRFQNWMNSTGEICDPSYFKWRKWNKTSQYFSTLLHVLTVY